MLLTRWRQFSTLMRASRRATLIADFAIRERCHCLLFSYYAMSRLFITPRAADDASAMPDYYAMPFSLMTCCCYFADAFFDMPPFFH
jgi:hypothetical protein